MNHNVTDLQKFLFDTNILLILKEIGQEIFITELFQFNFFVPINFLLFHRERQVKYLPTAKTSCCKK